MTTMPDSFDRALDSIKMRADTISTKPSTLRVMPTLAVGGSTLFIIQTYRVMEEGERSRDTIFLECHGGEGSVRLVLTPDVADTIARQRESLTGKSLSRAAVKRAAALKAQGHIPGFQRKRKGSK